LKIIENFNENEKPENMLIKCFFIDNIIGKIKPEQLFDTFELHELTKYI
jgi:hypothetical protein